MKRVTAGDAARWISITWACFWVYFTLAAGLAEADAPGQIAAQTILACIVFLGSAGIAWRWEGPGGFLLLLEGAAAAILFSTVDSPTFAEGAYGFIGAGLSIPAILAGILFLQSSRSHRVNLNVR